jgi:RHS repeat-associated protein
MNILYNIKAQYNYYPFGKQWEDVNLMANTNRYTFSGKEKQTVRDLGWLDFMARMYSNSEIPMFTTQDPLAEKKPWMSPYVYCSNNPVGRTDPNGMLDDDYFNKNGQYLGSDNAATDFVRIINQSDWDKNKEVKENGTETIDHSVGNTNSMNFSEATDMTTESALSVYQHYNPTDLSLEAHPNERTGVGGLAFNFKRENGIVSERIYIKIEGNRQTKMADRANQIINAFVHENKHYSDYKELGINQYLQIYKKSVDWLERRAVIKQMNHESWNKTTKEFQESIKRYGKSNGLLFPISPIPSIVIIK